jgi:hypothetical protein
MPTDWADLARREPHRTIVRDPSSYADVFAAIDDAIALAARWEPSPTDYVSLGKIKQVDEAGEEEFVDYVVCEVPSVAVRLPNTVRLCIGLLQFQEWGIGASPNGAALPHVGKLLRRRLRPTLDEAIDLAGFLVRRIYHMVGEHYTEPIPEILNLIERHFDPPVPEPLAVVLRESRRRLAVCRDVYVAATCSWGGRPQVKRFDNWDRRLARLLGSGPGQNQPAR